MSNSKHTPESIELTSRPPFPAPAPNVTPAPTTPDVPEAGLPNNSGELNPSSLLHPVDGGFHAWAFLGASFLIEAIVWGFPDAFGVFLDAYLTDPAYTSHPHASSLLPLIGPIASGIVYCVAPFLSPLINRYPNHRRTAMYVGLLLCWASLFAASYTTNVVILLALQGVVYAFGAALLYFPSLSYLAEWFINLRGFANGVLFAGTGVGGVVLPLTISKLLSMYGPNVTVGYRWVMSLDMYSRFREEVRISFAYFVPILWLPTFASTLNLDSTTSSATLAMFHTGSVIGRLTMGYLSDSSLKQCFILASSTLLATSVTIFVLWGVFSTNLAGLFSFCIIYGLLAGGWPSLWSGFGKGLTLNDPTLSMTLFGILLFTRGIGNIASTPLSAALTGFSSASPTTSFSTNSSSSSSQMSAKLGFNIAGGRFAKYGSPLITMNAQALGVANNNVEGYSAVPGQPGQAPLKYAAYKPKRHSRTSSTQQQLQFRYDTKLDNVDVYRVYTHYLTAEQPPNSNNSNIVVKVETVEESFTDTMPPRTHTTPTMDELESKKDGALVTRITKFPSKIFTKLTSVVLLITDTVVVTIHAYINANASIPTLIFIILVRISVDSNVTSSSTADSYTYIYIQKRISDYIYNFTYTYIHISFSSSSYIQISIQISIQGAVQTRLPTYRRRTSSFFENFDIRDIRRMSGSFIGGIGGSEVESTRSSEQRITPWQPDSAVSRCPHCDTSFHPLSNRKHHCRLCGRVVCALGVTSGKRVEPCSILFVVDPKTRQIEQVEEGVDYGVRKRKPSVDIRSTSSKDGGKPGLVEAGLTKHSEEEQSEEEKFLKGVRICRGCKPVLLREQYLRERNITMGGVTGEFLKLYEAFLGLEKEIEDSLPAFEELLVGLKMSGNNNGSDPPHALTAQTATAAAERKRLLQVFARYDALAKRIRNLPCGIQGKGSKGSQSDKGIKAKGTKGEYNINTSQERVQAAIALRAARFLEARMVGLGAVPSSVSAAQGKREKSNSKDSNMGTSPSIGIHPSSSSAIISSSSFSPSSSASQNLDATLQKTLQPLLEQESLLESYIAEATKARKFEDAKILRGNLREIRGEIGRVVGDV
ncbi:MFS general substrate transporter [Lentinula edodes]|uniref:MFS general substrate transporter n=1 Tax=Lentinula edodes TaxID=5353 RepID=A0A1Q3EGM1_LENED|nr:MFS general substrate transporter [Lentinula edodes]